MQKFLKQQRSLEILNGADIKTKLATKNYLQVYKVLEINATIIQLANKMSMQYQVLKKNQKHFLIATIALHYNLPILTENDKDFKYKNLIILPYRYNKK